MCLECHLQFLPGSWNHKREKESWEFKSWSESSCELLSLRQQVQRQERPWRPDGAAFGQRSVGNAAILHTLDGAIYTFKKKHKTHDFFYKVGFVPFLQQTPQLTMLVMSATLWRVGPMDNQKPRPARSDLWMHSLSNPPLPPLLFTWIFFFFFFFALLEDVPAQTAGHTLIFFLLFLF